MYILFIIRLICGIFYRIYNSSNDIISTHESPGISILGADNVADNVYNTTTKDDQNQKERSRYTLKFFFLILYF